MGIRVVVAEDSLLVREGIAKLLEAQDDIEWSRCATTRRPARRGRGPRARRRAHRHPDAADRHRRGHPGRGDAARDPSRASAWWCCRSTPSRPTPSSCSTAGREGRAYLLKERLSDGDQLVAAIHEVADGGSVVDPKVVEVAGRRPGSRGSNRRSTASRPARREVLGRDRPGQEQRRGRRVAGAVRAGRREAHQLAVLQARTQRGARRRTAG